MTNGRPVNRSESETASGSTTLDEGRGGIPSWIELRLQGRLFQVVGKVISHHLLPSDFVAQSVEER